MQITLTQLLRYAIVKGGQNLIVDTTTTPIDLGPLGLTYDQVWEDVIQPEVIRYIKYYPIEKRFNVTTLITDWGCSIDFTLDSNNIGYVNSGSPGTYPFAIKKATPVSSFGGISGYPGLAAFNSIYKNSYSDYGSPNRLVQPLIAPINYSQKPILILPFGGMWDVSCHYEYLVTQDTDDTNKLVEVTIDDLNLGDINRYNIFKNLVLAAFLQQISSTMTLYTNPVLEITNNYSNLQKQGQNLEEATLEKMAKTYPTWLVG